MAVWQAMQMKPYRRFWRAHWVTIRTCAVRITITSTAKAIHADSMAAAITAVTKYKNNPLHAVQGIAYLTEYALPARL